MIYDHSPRHSKSAGIEYRILKEQVNLLTEETPFIGNDPTNLSDEVISFLAKKCAEIRKKDAEEKNKNDIYL